MYKKILFDDNDDEDTEDEEDDTFDCGRGKYIHHIFLFTIYWMLFKRLLMKFHRWIFVIPLNYSEIDIDKSTSILNGTYNYDYGGNLLRWIIFQ